MNSGVEIPVTGTPHNSAAISDIASSVLLPGDPLRAKYVAENFLENARQVTGVRNMLGFTGLYKGTPVTVMGSGMGGPSAGLYSYELFKIYGVKQIIRIGTAGGLQPYLELGDVVCAMTACTDSNYAYQYRLPGLFAPSADFELLKKASNAAQKFKQKLYAGSVFSSDLYSEYNALGREAAWKPWADMGCIVQDMETYALYCNAAYLQKRALSILTNVASCITGHALSSDRQLTALHAMFTIALECV